jgi:hypothetical protein
MPKDEKGFRGVSLKSELLTEVERFITEHPEYRGAAEFVSEAIRLRIEELRKFPQPPSLPRYDHFNMGVHGVRITDRQLHRISTPQVLRFSCYDNLFFTQFFTFN